MLEWKNMLLANIIIFLLGLSVGSFLNVVLFRLEKGEGFGGRSRCLHCGHVLSWKDLLPVVSFIWLRGTCQYCNKKISIQYPLVELVTGALLLLTTYWLLPITNVIELFFWWYIASSLLVIFVYDLKHFLIPDKILIPAIVITFLYVVISYKLEAISYVIAALIASGFFLFIFLLSRGAWMGFGDVKLAILLGLLLGWPKILAGLFLAFLFGAIIGVGMMLLRGKGVKSEMPFAPFLITGSATALWWGNQLINWYLRFMLV